MTAIAEHQQSDTAVDAASLPLLDRIGGMPGIEWLVDRFVDEIRSDRELAPFLACVDWPSFKKSQAAFFTEAFGGDSPRASVDLRRPQVELEGEQFFRVALLLHDTLLSLGLPSELQEELVVAVVLRALSPDTE